MDGHQAWEENFAYFNAHREEIERTYGRKTYVVIGNQQILDNGPDPHALAKKHHRENPIQHVLITNIATDEPVDMPSFESR